MVTLATNDLAIFCQLISKSVTNLYSLPNGKPSVVWASKDCLDKGEMAEKRGISFRICHTKETTLIRIDKKKKKTI